MSRMSLHSCISPRYGNRMAILGGGGGGGVTQKREGCGATPVGGGGRGVVGKRAWKLFFVCRIQCCGSTKFWYGSGSVDPYLQTSTKQWRKKILMFFCILLFEGTFTLFFKYKNDTIRYHHNDCLTLCYFTIFVRTRTMYKG